MKLYSSSTLCQIGILCLFLIAYCIQPLLVDVVKYNGGAHSSTFLFLIPHYYSMVLVGLLPTDKKLTKCNWRKGMLVSLLDLLNQVLKKAGLVFAGASVYIIIDSSSMVWTAVWSRILLRRHLHYLQWIGITLVSIGVGLKALQVDVGFHNDEFVGIILISMASILMGLTFVLNEKFMVDGKDSIEGPHLVCMMGVFCSIAITIWTFVWTVPQFNTLVTQNIIKNQGSEATVLVSLLLLLLCGFIQSSTLWYLMKHLGAVTTGILKGLKVALVFLLSHIIFCHMHPSQCLNFYTGASAIICVLGVGLYSIVTGLLKEVHSTEIEKVKKDGSAASRSMKQEALLEEREILVSQASMVVIARDQVD